MSKVAIVTGGNSGLGQAFALALAKAGADIATVPYKVIEQCLKHPLTDAGIEKFKKDYIAVFGE